MSDQATRHQCHLFLMLSYTPVVMPLEWTVQNNYYHYLAVALYSRLCILLKKSKDSKYFLIGSYSFIIHHNMLNKWRVNALAVKLRY